MIKKRKFKKSVLWAVSLLISGCTTSESTCGCVEPTRRGADFGYKLDDKIRINQIQMEGTHNSYHIAVTDAEDIFDYTLPPLDEQLSNHGVRQFELDIQYDRGDEKLHVFHFPILDDISSCDLFVDCLSILKEWSDANPGHHPLMIHIEPKETIPYNTDGFMERIDQEILSVWPRDLLITPDDIRQDKPSVLEGMQSYGWPTLSESRGKALFVMLDKSDIREKYTYGLQHTDGRVMFAEADSNQEYGFAVVQRLDNPETDFDKIQQAVRDGYLVRTRSDGEPGPPDSYERFEAALDSGAQMISTNYPHVDPSRAYAIEIPDAWTSRCNPLIAPADCTSADIEAPEKMR